MRTLSTSTKLYRAFKEIDGSEYHTLIRFYESKKTEIDQLNFERYFDILVDYTTALFEVGAYAKHITTVQQVIQLSIEYNIQFYKGEDIYFKCLYQKAAAHFNLLEYDTAIHILKELIKIAPYHGLSILFLKKCINRTQPSYIKVARAASIVLFLGTAIITAIEVIAIRPFSPMYTATFEQFRLITLVLGIFVLAGAFLYHRYQTNHQVNTFVKKIRRSK